MPVFKTSHHFFISLRNFIVLHRTDEILESQNKPFHLTFVRQAFILF